MSLKSTRSTVFLFLSFVFVALVAASCGGSTPAAPTGPSSLALSAGAANETPSDEPGATEPTEPTEPEPADEGGEPTPTPTPEDEAEAEPAPPAPAPPAPAPAPAPTMPPAPTYEVPTNPGPYPAPPLKNAIFWTPSPATHPRVFLKVDPSPVPFSGVPVQLFSCRDLPHTWYYTQIIHAQSSWKFRVVERENYFDGRLVSRTPEGIEVGPHGTATINSRWCSAFGFAHTAQHRFRIIDEEGVVHIVNGPIVRLDKNPHYVPPKGSVPPPQPFGAGGLRLTVAGG